MKKILLGAICFFFCGIAFSQIYNPAVVTQYGEHSNRKQIDSVLLFPTGCGKPGSLDATSKSKKMAAVKYDSCNHKTWFYDPATDDWDTTAGGSGVGGGGAGGVIIVDTQYHKLMTITDSSLATLKSIRFRQNGVDLVPDTTNTTISYDIETTEGGDTTVFSDVIDSTGQPAQRVLYGVSGNHISSSRYFLYDSVQRKLGIGFTNLTAVNANWKLAVTGDIYGSGAVSSATLFTRAMVATTDTTNYKPVGRNLTGGEYRQFATWGGLIKPFIITPTFQQVSNTQVGGMVFTKTDSMQLGAFQLKLFGTANGLLDIHQTAAANGLIVNSAGGGVISFANSGYGVYGSSNLTGVQGIRATSDNLHLCCAWPGGFSLASPTNTDTTLDILWLDRGNPSSTGAGGAINFTLGGINSSGGQIGFNLVNASTLESEMRIAAFDGTTNGIRMKVNGQGILIPNGIMPTSGAGSTDSVIRRNATTGQFYLSSGTSTGIGSGGSQDLQSVTDIGTTTTHNLSITSYNGSGVAGLFVQKLSGPTLSATAADITGGYIYLDRFSTGNGVWIKQQQAKTGYDSIFLPNTGNTIDTLATLYNLRNGTGFPSNNLSYNSGTHAVDITGGTSAVIPIGASGIPGLVSPGTNVSVTGGGVLSVNMAGINNSGGTTFSGSRFNFIPGAGIGLTVGSGSVGGNSTVDVTISNSGSIPAGAYQANFYLKDSAFNTDRNADLNGKKVAFTSAGSNVLEIDPTVAAKRVTIGADQPDSLSHILIVNNPSQRNLFVGKNRNFVVGGGGSREDDSSFYNIIQVLDTTNETNTSTNTQAGLHPRAALFVNRELYVGTNNLNMEEQGGLYNQYRINLSTVDSTTLVPSTSDFVWTTIARMGIVNQGSTHRTTARSGTTFDWDAVGVNVAQLEFNTAVGNSTHLTKWWAGYISHAVGSSTRDTVDNLVGFYSTYFTGPKIGRMYNFAANNFSVANVDTVFFLYETPVASSAKSWSYIHGKLVIGGQTVGTTTGVGGATGLDKLTVNGAVKITDTLKMPNIAQKNIDTTNFKPVVVDASGNHFKMYWASGGGGAGTVTATAGSLTSNSVVLGAGTTDTKVVAGITTDGTSQLTLGVNTTTLGKLKMFGNTSGDVTIQPTAAAGTATVLTAPAVTGTIVQFTPVVTTASDATPDPQGDGRWNNYQITALGAAITTVNAPTGAPSANNVLIMRIKDNGTARAISGWDAVYRAGINIPFPTTTIVGQTMKLRFEYNSTDSKWDLTGIAANSLAKILILSIVFGGLATALEKRIRRLAA